MSQNKSPQLKNYTLEEGGGGGKYIFSESSLCALSKKLNWDLPSKNFIELFRKNVSRWSSLHLKCISFNIFLRNYF